MDIKPFKIKYYLEKKDPDFEEKMHDVLLVYKQVEMQIDENGSIIIPEDGHMTHTLSYDEKPGIQAVANKYPDHNPDIENGFFVSYFVHFICPVIDNRSSINLIKILINSFR